MGTHSSIHACRIPWTEEPGKAIQSTGRKESDTTEQLTHFLGLVKCTYVINIFLKDGKSRTP